MDLEGIGHHELRGDFFALAEARARGAHAERRVEREALRGKLGKRDAAAGARLAEHALAVAVDQDDELPVALAKGELHGFGDARSVLPTDAHAIDDERDRVLLFLVDRGQIVQACDAPVDAHAHEPALAEAVEQLFELALAVADERREKRELGPLPQREDLARDRLGASRRHRLAAGRAPLLADLRVEDAQVVVDLGNRADRGARIGGRALLLDGNRRR